MSAPTHVSLHDLSLHYPNTPRPAVNAVTLEAVPGRVLALLGPSGSGKSTVLKLIAGLLWPSGGDVRFDGASMVGVPPEQRRAALMFQQSLLLPHLSAQDNAALALTFQRVPRRERRARAADMLAQVGLAGFEARRPGQLSGGQQQRVALARALLASPRVLLLDEPLSSLDAHLRDSLRDLLRDLQRRTGTTTIVVTHDQREATLLADSIALLFDGCLAQNGPPEVFYTRPATLDVAAFFGAANVIVGTRAGGVFTSALGVPLPLDAASPAPDGPAQLVVRPQALALAEAAAENSVPARVVARQFAGDAVVLHLRAGQDVPLVVHAPPSSPWCVGEAVAVAFPLGWALAYIG